MACDTCTHTLEGVGTLNALWHVFHCPRCGTMVIEKHSSLVADQDVIRREKYVPKAVLRARELLGVVWEETATELRGGLVNHDRVVRGLRDLAEAVNGTRPPE